MDAATSAWSADSFIRAWENYLAATQAFYEQLREPGSALGSPPLAFFEAWQHFAKSLGVTAEGGYPGVDPHDFLSSSAPALGWNREYQLIAQRLQEIGREFQRRSAEFLKHGTDLSEHALQAVRRRLATDPHLAQSAHAAYEAWIDSAETAYSQAAHSEAFARTLGELCNLVSAYRVERGKLLEAFARQLDLPSRAEVDSLHRRIRELEVRVRAAAARPSPSRPKKRASRTSTKK